MLTCRWPRKPDTAGISFAASAAGAAAGPRQQAAGVLAKGPAGRAGALGG